MSTIAAILMTVAYLMLGFVAMVLTKRTHDLNERVRRLENKPDEPWCEHCGCHHVDRGPWIGAPESTEGES